MSEVEKLKIVRKDITGNLPRNVLLIPFAYQNKSSYDDTINSLLQQNNQVQWKYSALTSEDNELFEHIDQLIGTCTQNNNCGSNPANSCIGNCLELKTNGIQTYNPRNKKVWIEIYDVNEKIGYYSLKNIKIVLFKTGIGFLMLDIEYQKSVTVTEIAKLNNIIKSTKNSGYSFYYNTELELTLDKTDILESSPENMSSYIKVEFNKEICYIPINKIGHDLNDSINENFVYQLFGQADDKYMLKLKVKYLFEELIDTLLSEVHVTTYFNNVYDKTNNKAYPKKAHIFSSVLVEKDGWQKEDFETAFFHLRKGYKDTYIPSEAEFNLEDNPEIQKPFSNSYWGISREGCANLCHLTENEKTNAFFKGNYADRLNNYLYIYLLALHQYYGLLYLTGETSELSNSSDTYINSNSEFIKISSLRDEINFFYLKCIYEEISHITHQAKLYNMMIEEFGIRRMLNELHFEMDRIVGIISQIRTSKEEEIRRKEEEAKEKEERDKKQIEDKKNKRFKIFTIAGGIFTFIQACSAALQTWDITANIRPEFQGFQIINSMMTVILSIVMGFIIWWFWQR